MNSLRAVRGGSIEALVESHQGPIRAYLRFLGCPAGSVDDVLQETFLCLLSGKFVEQGDGATRAYLRRVARNLFLKGVERGRREVATEAIEAADHVWDERIATDDGEGYLEALRGCLSGLSERTRSILQMRYASRLRRSEIGLRFELSEAGVKSILVRTKQALRDCVERRLHA